VTLPSNQSILYGEAARVVTVTPFEALDGATYQTIELTRAIEPFPGTLLEDIQFQKAVLETGVNALASLDSGAHGVRLTLDSQQTGISVNDIVLLTRDSEAIPFRVLALTHLEEIKFGIVVSRRPSSLFLATRLDLFPGCRRTGTTISRLRLRFGACVGRSLAAKIALSFQLRAGAAFRWHGGAAAEGGVRGSPVARRGQRRLGFPRRWRSRMTVWTLFPQDGQAIRGRLAVPVRGAAWWTPRGETVSNEVLGSGDPSQAFQSFKLKKNPGLPVGSQV
jgi:hypothetical protein